MANIQSLGIEIINLSLRVREVDPETVTGYIDALERGVTLPPGSVSHDQETNTFYLVDGFHRLEAHSCNGATEIMVDVVTESKQEARWRALGANAKHGRQMSSEDKRNAIAIAFVEFPNESSRSIADHIGCSHQTVLNHKKNFRCQNLTPEAKQSSASEGMADAETIQLPTDEPKAEVKRVTGRDNKSYPERKNVQESAEKPLAGASNEQAGEAGKADKAIAPPIPIALVSVAPPASAPPIVTPLPTARMPVSSSPVIADPYLRLLTSVKERVDCFLSASVAMTQALQVLLAAEQQGQRSTDEHTAALDEVRNPFVMALNALNDAHTELVNELSKPKV